MYSFQTVVLHGVSAFNMAQCQQHCLVAERRKQGHSSRHPPSLPGLTQQQMCSQELLSVVLAILLALCIMPVR